MRLDEYIRVPFALANAPATLRRALDIILAGFKWEMCLVYYDDITMFSQLQEEHLQHVNDMLNALKGARVTLPPVKYSFFIDRI